ncbi:MAG: alpha/beta hydrolase [Oscillospiraceae bacterium]|nr:alpha/beta hydrolase [Oscillospiraceae bacterium]
MSWWVWILLALGLFLTALIVTSIILMRYSIVRTDPYDYNFTPGRDDPDSFPPSGDSPYRSAAREGNIWWNTQPLERMEITSRDGLRLVGHYLPADKPTKRLAFVIHGHRCVSGEMGFISRMYHRWGFNVFCADQRAHGKSEGRYIGMGWLERDDMNRWIDALLTKLGGDTVIVLHGISMGAATVMMMSGARDLSQNVRCAVEDCGYTDAFDTFYTHMRRDFKPLPFKMLILCIASGLTKCIAGYRFREASALRVISSITFPMLFVHGTHDDVVPFEMMRRLYDAHGGNKEMLVIELAHHGTCYFDNTPAYEARVRKFIDTYLGAEQANAAKNIL